MKTRNILSIDPYVIDSKIITITKMPITWIRIETIKNILRKLNEKQI